MLGFASWGRRGANPRLALLRVSVADFEVFLSQWTAWLSQAGVGQALEAAGPGYFAVAAE